MMDGRFWRADACCCRVISCALCVADDAAELAEVSAPVFTVAVAGMPLDSPWTWMLAALTTCSAAMLMLPDTRMPASPGSTVPSGATRSTSPLGTSGIGFSVLMPAPVLGTVGDRLTLPTASYSRRCGV